MTTIPFVLILCIAFALQVPVAVNSGSLAADANNENCHDPTIAHSNAEFNIFPASGPIPAADDEIFEADSSN